LGRKVGPQKKTRKRLDFTSKMYYFGFGSCKKYMFGLAGSQELLLTFVAFFVSAKGYYNLPKLEKRGGEL
jgi:hypothetical protein